ncbi:Inosine/uridine-preferring nucleoside hydrolase [Viridothelium virens]|uniref:Inosine/uridine-preferring nucleoside hydrolase n=1 Tax=Viridothelium virens TaxID=1048519 RepID=A0A6A6HA73_VIRVR|nr:Inosine/uridine-preferring nucleoside hydrolase [Viridothelium virens]
MDKQEIPEDPSALWEFYSKAGFRPTNLWLDCDTGLDLQDPDSFAILMASMHPSLKLLGISTVHGNAPLENTTYNTLAVLEAIGRRDIPVYSGASKPFCRAPAHAAAIHGSSGLDGTTLLPNPIMPAQINTSAIEAMYSALRSSPPQSAWLVATGALTNVAILFLLHPDLVSHIAGLSIMGGVVGGGFNEAKLGTKNYGSNSFGNWTPYAEFNIFCDPEAAHSLFSNPALAAKTTLIPLDITHLVFATESVRAKLLHGTTAPPSIPASSISSITRPSVRPLFHEILIFFATTYAEVFGMTTGPPLHDPLAVAAVFAPALFRDGRETGERERWSVDVVRDDAIGDVTGSGGKKGVGQVGRTVARKVEGDRDGVRIPRGVNVARFWETVDLCLSRAERMT